jgi:diaminohydroxyphosphoribosylaminopyrimidine deaminase/5-amino-6-(5-phosphoribosylamino)uracil reductase
MIQAISLARKGLGRTAPNPPVGALIVKNSKIIGKGFHPKAGLPHAEIFALEQAGKNAKNATLYVTLEPCTHFGKTPPCVDAIISAGIKRVVIGVKDPNPVVAGKGIKKLKAHGIKVDLAATDEALKLIRWYEKWMKNGIPYVILKVAMTLDGKIATTKGDSKWITSVRSREMVHVLRNEVDAVLVGIGTVLADDPQLTCRIPFGGRDPLRVIVDKDFVIPAGARCLGERCIVFTSKDPKKRKEILDTGTKVIKVSSDQSGRLSWDEMLSFLGKQGLHSVMIEGGSRINSSVINAGKVDRLLAFVAPMVLGGGVPVTQGNSPDKIKNALPLKIQEIKQIENDILIDAYLGE